MQYISEGKIMSRKLSNLSVPVLCVLMSGAAVAADMQDQSGNKQNSAEGTINAGGFVIKPTLNVVLGKNDNVGMANGVKTASNFTKINPRVSVAMPTHGQVYSATYAGSYANYSGSTVDNFTDHNFGLAANNDWSSRVNTMVNVDYNKGHDGRNALPNANTFKESWHTTGVKGMAHYGADNAQGQFELTVGQIAKRYDTNNSTRTQLMNIDTTNVVGAFFYKIGAATHMIVQAGNTKLSYLDAAAKIRDSAEQQYMIGVKWDATAKTSGNIRIGQVRKTFNLATTPSATSSTWDGNIKWSPLTYSIVDLTLSQKAAESFGTGSFMISRDTTIAWSHEWASKIKSNLNIGDGLDTYQNIAQTNKRQTYGAKVSYAVSRWLNAGLEYQNSKRNSTSAPLTYTQSQTMLVLDGTL